MSHEDIDGFSTSLPSQSWSPLTVTQYDCSLLKEFDKSADSMSTKDSLPFCPTPWISFVVNKPDTVSLRLMSLDGKKVAHLFNGLLQRGTYYLDFTKAPLPKALFFMIYCSSVDTAHTVILGHGK